MGLSLGGVSFTAFEVPSVVSFGGSQSLAVHRLPGGVRVVDSLGPDDSDIAWQGILSGSEATDRARALDALRISGEPVTLAWDEFLYVVIIDALHLAFCNSWWIPYKISCVVVDDPAAQAVPTVISILGAVASDLASAAGFIDVSAATAAVGTAGAAGPGTAPYATASFVLSNTAQGVAASIQSAEPGLSAPTIPAVVSAASTLALATAARGYVGRAIANYAQVAF